MIFSELASKVGVETLRKLKLGITGGAYVPPELQKKFFEEIGVPLIQLYGLSEGLVVTMQHPTIRVYGSIGTPLPGVDVRIIDPKSGEDLGIGRVGELLVKSPWVMKGYVEEEENERAFINGWLRTGDLVEMDEKGLLYFRGVRKRFIKYKAYPILPRDLELILKTHPAVEDVRVVGEEEPEVGQIPVAYVKLKEEYKGRISEEDLMNYVNSRVAFYKKIRKIYFITG
jgi:long-chain acyl-CoA synthetase